MMQKFHKEWEVRGNGWDMKIQALHRELTLITEGYKRKRGHLNREIARKM